MKGDFHVRFRENAGVKLPCVTRLAAILLNMIWILVMFSIWFYPPITFYIVKGTKDNLGLRKKIVMTVLGVSL